jgi:hypothetical protein
MKKLMLLSSLHRSRTKKLVLYSIVREDEEADASFVAASFKKLRSWFFILSSEEMKKLIFFSSPHRRRKSRN